VKGNITKYWIRFAGEKFLTTLITVTSHTERPRPLRSPGARSRSVVRSRSQRKPLVYRNEDDRNVDVEVTCDITASAPRAGRSGRRPTQCDVYSFAVSIRLIGRDGSRYGLFHNSVMDACRSWIVFNRSSANTSSLHLIQERQEEDIQIERGV